MRPGDEPEREEAATRVMPAIAGGSPELDEGAAAQRVTGVRCKAIIGFTILAAAVTVVFGVYPDPLVDFAEAAGEALAASAP